jgi:5,10-methenyltetrahydrofolate synthetase
VGKNILRSELLRSLNALSSDKIQDLSFSVTNQIIKLLKMFPELTSQIGAGYLPIQAEIAPVYQELLRAIPVTLAYPIAKGDAMSFAIPNGMPRGEIWLERPYHEVTPDWLFVPGLGFGLDGKRLGRGKGYYDRYLENSKALKMGIAWSKQLSEKIPVESHDCHMDFIITDKFCWDVKQQVKF